MNSFPSDEEYQRTIVYDDQSVVHYYGYHIDNARMDYEDEQYYECLELKPRTK